VMVKLLGKCHFEGWEEAEGIDNIMMHLEV
jgi:hypothetical protein